jgi:hypothetical protein
VKAVTDLSPDSAAVPAVPEPAPAQSARPGRGRLPWLLAWVAFVPVAVLRAGNLNDSDVFWQIRTGLLTISRRAIPTTDPFSWTVHGRPWTLNSWGFNVLVAAGYRLAGLPGVAWECAGLILAAAGLTLLLASRLGASPLLAGAALFLASAPLARWLQPRPELIDYIAVPALVLMLQEIVRRPKLLRWLIAVALLSAIWVNLHAAALLGVAIAACAAVALLARRDTREAGWWCAAAAAAAAAGAFVNPQGFGLIAQTAAVRSASAGAAVAEWSHFDPASPMQWAILAAGTGAVIIAIRRSDRVLAAALAVCWAGAIVATRLQPVLVLLAVPMLAAAASRPTVVHYVRSRRLVLYPGAAVAVLALTAAALPSLGHIGRPNPAVYPRRVIADIPPGCRLFNSYLLGGLVLLERPDVRVSVDSRNDLYGAARVLADQRVLDGKGNTGRALAGAGCVLVPPVSGLARELRASPAWRLVATEPAAALFVRVAQPATP